MKRASGFAFFRGRLHELRFFRHDHCHDQVEDDAGPAGQREDYPEQAHERRVDGQVIGQATANAAGCNPVSTSSKK